VPRPMAQTLHADKPNKLLHFDFLYIGHGLKGVDYIIVLKDDLSSYCRLIPAVAANAVTTAAALIDWFATFGVVLDWVSDRGFHFRNVVVCLIREQNHSSRRFTLAYCPWSNGTVEVVNREILRVLRALCSELKIPFREWPNLLPLVQGILNSAILPRLGNCSPLTAMTAFQPIILSHPSQARVRFVRRLSTLREHERCSVKESSQLSMRLILCIRNWQKNLVSHDKWLSTGSTRKSVSDHATSKLEILCSAAFYPIQQPKLALRRIGPYRIVQVLTDLCKM
jgi:hypothetical protein